MKVLQLTARVAHTCSRRGCKKDIEPGEMMVRRESREHNCAESYRVYKYFHYPECWASGHRGERNE